MNSKNSKTSDPRRVLLNLTHKIDLRKKINILLCQISAFIIFIWKNIKKSYKNYKFKISAPKRN